MSVEPEEGILWDQSLISVTLTKTICLFESGIAEELHRGAQLYVSRHGQLLADLAFGESHPGVAMQTNTLLAWMSASKPIAAIALGQLNERGLLSFDDRIEQFIPEFSNRGKETITIRHLLTHTAGLRGADRIEEDLSWNETIARICRLDLDPGAHPGKQAAYHLRGSWFLLGEVLRRLDGRHYEHYVRQNIFEPLGMKDSWIGMPESRWRDYGHRMGLVHSGMGGQLHPDAALNAMEACTHCHPGGGGRGPIRELAHLYEFLISAWGDGFRNQPDILSSGTVRELVKRHRSGLVDLTFQHVIDTGLGFILDSNRYGRETVPYGYGAHCSEETFGHSGSQCACAFADPRAGLVVAWACNGRPGEPRHQRRARAINNAIYEDLGLALS